MAESLTIIHDRNFSISESNIQSIGAENFIQPMGKKTGAYGPKLQSDAEEVCIFSYMKEMDLTS